MSIAWFRDILVYPGGAPATNESVLVTLPESDVLAELYEDQEGTIPAANPDNTDGFGNLSFFALSGEYDLVIRDFRIRIYLNDPEFVVGAQPFEYLMPVAQTTATVDHPLNRDPVAVQVLVDGMAVEDYSVQFTVPNEQVRIGFDISARALIRLM